MNKIIASAEQVNSDLKIRLLPRTDGRKTSIRLDTLTWDAIEYSAQKRGQHWQEWVNDVLDAHPDTVNMAGELRRAVLFQLMHGAIGAGVVALSSTHQIAGKSYRRLTDAELERFLKDAHVIHEDRDFVIFALLIGFHGTSQTPFVCVHNRLLGGLHLVLDGTQEGI